MGWRKSLTVENLQNSICLPCQKVDREGILECLNTSLGGKVPFRLSKSQGWMFPELVTRSKRKEKIWLKYLNNENTKPLQQATNGFCVPVPQNEANTFCQHSSNTH